MSAELGDATFPLESFREAAPHLRTSHGKSESREPSKAAPFESERFRRPILNLIEDYERALDAEEGIGPSQNIAFMRSEEKDDEIIQRWEGVHSSVVARQAPHLGSEQTIQRIRRKNHRHGDDGRPGYRPRESGRRAA